MPLYVTICTEVMSLRTYDLVRQTLVIAFGVVMRNEALSGCPQRLSKQNHPLQTRFLDAAHKRSAYAFRFGDRAGSFTDFTPVPANIFQKLSGEQWMPPRIPSPASVMFRAI